MAYSVTADDVVFRATLGNTTISVKEGDITNCSADIIAFPINNRFAFSGGLSYTIASAAGPLFKQSVKQILKCEKKKKFCAGEIKMFPAFDLKAKHVMAVVSSFNSYHTEELYDNVICAADNEKAISLCLPGFGTGSLGVSSELAAKGAAAALSNFLCSEQIKLVSLKEIIFVDFNCEVVRSFVKEFRKLPGCYIIFVSPHFESETDGEVGWNGSVEADHFDCFSRVNPVTSGISSQDVCAICLDNLLHTDENSKVVKLNKCHHAFHENCIMQAFVSLQSQCPTCKEWYGVPRGNQPSGGKMNVTLRKGKIPGYPDANGFYEIMYDLPSGIQSADHPRPGVPFTGTIRYAYLPNTPEGNSILQLLRIAFRYRLTFTVGDSVTTGARNVVVWNNIHHKTSLHGGAFGFPDPTYLTRVREELAAVGITEDLLQKTAAKKI